MGNTHRSRSLRRDPPHHSSQPSTQTILSQAQTANSMDDMDAMGATEAMGTMDAMDTMDPMDSTTRSPPSPKFQNDSPTWLDQLPVDVCVRIASFAKASDYLSAISLLQVSPTQCAAVKQALSYKIDLVTDHTDVPEDNVQRLPILGKTLLPFVRNDAREVRLPGYRVYDPLYQPCFTASSMVKLVVHDLPSAPDFERACIPALVSNIRVLQLRLNNIEAFARLLTRLSSPDLEELKLETMKDICLHELLTDDQEDHSLLATCFPSVKNLYLSCDRCVKIPHHPSFLWRVIEKFQMLKDVTLTESVPEDAIEKLRQVERVTVIEGKFLDLIERIPDRIVGVVTSRSWSNNASTGVILKENQFEKLTKCKRLESLNCCVKPGAERDLVLVAANLHVLGLAFKSRLESCKAVEIHPPVNGALLNAVRDAHFLKSIHLVNLRMHASERREILKILGKQLEEYEEHWSLPSEVHELVANIIFFRANSASYKLEMEELIETLRTAALHNTSLRRFEIYMRPELFASRFPVPDMWPDLKRAVDLLLRRAPQLETRRWMEMVYELGIARPV